MYKCLCICLLLCFVLIGCTAPETAVPVAESVEQVVEVETAVSTPLPTEPPATATPVPPTPTPEPDLVDLVMAQQDAINAGDTANVLAMYAEDIQLSDTLLTPCVGKEAVTAYVDYEVGIHSQFDLTDCVSDGQIVTCRGEMMNDWQTAVNLSPFIYDSMSFTFQDEQIIAETHTLSEASAAEAIKLLNDFGTWSFAKRPATTKELIDEDGLIIPNGDNAQSITELLTSWSDLSFVVSADQMLGLWESESCRWDTCHYRYMEFLEDGTGFLYTTEDTMSQPFDPDNGDAIQFEYWFEESLLHVRNTAGFWAESGVVGEVPGRCESEQVGQFMLEGSPQGQVSFMVINASCSFHNALVTSFRVWDWVK